MGKKERDQRHDTKRRAESATYPLYRTARWLKLRAYQLSTHPLCAMCLKSNRYTPATVCDHIDPHRGDVAKFWTGPFQSLCKPHHDEAKQAEERHGYTNEVGVDGLPLDPRHPFNQ